MVFDYGFDEIEIDRSYHFGRPLPIALEYVRRFVLNESKSLVQRCGGAEQLSDDFFCGCSGHIFLSSHGSDFAEETADSHDDC
jgi:hypothetical protein